LLHEALSLPRKLRADNAILNHKKDREANLFGFKAAGVIVAGEVK